MCARSRFANQGCRSGGTTLVAVVGGRDGLTPELTGRHTDVLREETREITVVTVAEFVGQLDQRPVRGAEQASRDGYPSAIQIMLRRSTYAAPELLEEPRTG